MTDITFSAAVYKVQTLVDGGIRVTLDLPESDVMQMAQLAKCQQFGVVLDVSVKPREQQDDGSSTRKYKY